MVAIAVALSWNAASVPNAAAAGVEPNAVNPALSSNTPKRVVVVLSASSSDSRRLLPVIEELAKQTSVLLSVKRVDRLELADLGVASADLDCVARVWIDLRRASSVIVYLHATASDRVLVRRIQRAPGQDELVREELEHILVTAIEGILKGSALGEPRAQALARLGIRDTQRPPAPSVSAPMKPPRPRLAAGYEAAIFAPEAPIVHGPCLALAGELRTALHPGLLGQIGYRWPVRATNGPLSVTATALVWGAQATLEPVLSSRFSLRLGLGLVAHTVWTEARSDTGVPLVQDRAVSHLALARASAAAVLKVSPHVSSFVLLSMDALLSATRFVVSNEEADSVVLRPHRFQPALALGVLLP